MSIFVTHNPKLTHSSSEPCFLQRISGSDAIDGDFVSARTLAKDGFLMVDTPTNKTRKDILSPYNCACSILSTNDIFQNPFINQFYDKSKICAFFYNDILFEVTETDFAVYFNEGRIKSEKKRIDEDREDPDKTITTEKPDWYDCSHEENFKNWAREIIELNKNLGTSEKYTGTGLSGSLPQLLIPTTNGLDNYISITPLSSGAVCGAAHMAFFSEGENRKVKRLKNWYPIGGENPQNSGYIAAKRIPRNLYEFFIPCITDQSKIKYSLIYNGFRPYFGFLPESSLKLVRFFDDETKKEKNVCNKASENFKNKFLELVLAATKTQLAEARAIKAENPDDFKKSKISDPWLSKKSNDVKFKETASDDIARAIIKACKNREIIYDAEENKFFTLLSAAVLDKVEPILK